MSTISERFQELLSNKGLTPYQFSNKTGMNQSTISRILNKGSKPNASNMKVICDFFNVNEEWFLTGQTVEGSKPKELTFDELVKQKVKEIVDPIMEEQKKLNRIVNTDLETLNRKLNDLQSIISNSGAKSLGS